MAVKLMYFLHPLKLMASFNFTVWDRLNIDYSQTQYHKNFPMTLFRFERKSIFTKLQKRLTSKAQQSSTNCPKTLSAVWRSKEFDFRLKASQSIRKPFAVVFPFVTYTTHLMRRQNLFSQNFSSPNARPQISTHTQTYRMCNNSLANEDSFSRGVFIASAV
jgi:hypothetical protein